MDNDKFLQVLNELQEKYTKFEEQLEDASSHKHEPKLLKITKIEGTDNWNYKEGHTEYGLCEGIEVGKCVYLYNKSLGGRWFITSVVQSIDEDNKEFHTMNSIYKYEWLDTESLSQK